MATKYPHGQQSQKSPRASYSSVQVLTLSPSGLALSPASVITTRDIAWSMLPLASLGILAWSTKEGPRYAKLKIFYFLSVPRPQLPREVEGTKQHLKT